ncbi:acetyl-coenzyme A synthetase N-terminal domain-containing protein [Xenorhabdus koppenhoeferi]|uniref:Acetyl-coenzyme A synthetase N-terminus n=1 Tax=Xenorhabdus koppenhoeferi TaxID=351659 RepID=A0A1I7GUJ6_9GAMM|nr:acetyl-coenzyme A synthetase N-terminal domain-containing protein [Xenorhabdus koppenhoeferi]SFU52079.1 Acetyl-coenzyme A synthetase N-terminus [Xenorhabdus koppenhoeferi]
MSFQDFYQHSIDDPNAFWAEQAKRIYWQQPFDQVLMVNRGLADINWVKGRDVDFTTLRQEYFDAEAPVTWLEYIYNKKLFTKTS